MRSLSHRHVIGLGQTIHNVVNHRIIDIRRVRGSVGLYHTANGKTFVSFILLIGLQPFKRSTILIRYTQYSGIETTRATGRNSFGLLQAIRGTGQTASNDTVVAPKALLANISPGTFLLKRHVKAKQHIAFLLLRSQYQSGLVDDVAFFAIVFQTSGFKGTRTTLGIKVENLARLGNGGHTGALRRRENYSQRRVIPLSLIIVETDAKLGRAIRQRHHTGLCRYHNMIISRQIPPQRRQILLERDPSQRRTIIVTSRDRKRFNRHIACLVRKVGFTNDRQGHIGTPFIHGNGLIGNVGSPTRVLGSTRIFPRATENLVSFALKFGTCNSIVMQGSHRLSQVGREETNRRQHGAGRGGTWSFDSHVTYPFPIPQLATL